jgi:hypothetical protein
VSSVALPLVPSVGLSVATAGAAALGAAGVAGASLTGAPTCLFAAATGAPCPFCGLTHGVAELGAGHLAAAVALHPLAPLAALLAIAVPIALARGRSLAVPVPALVVLAALLVTTWIARLAG